MHPGDEIYDDQDSLLDQLLGFGVIVSGPLKEVAPDRHTPIAVGRDDRPTVDILRNGIGRKDSVISLAQESKVRDLYLHDACDRAIPFAIVAMARSTIGQVEVDT